MKSTDTAPDLHTQALHIILYLCNVQTTLPYIACIQLNSQCSRQKFRVGYRCHQIHIQMRLHFHIDVYANAIILQISLAW